MYIVKINEYVIRGNPKIAENCGHRHKTIESAEKCRMTLTYKLQLPWTDATIEEVE